MAQQYKQVLNYREYLPWKKTGGAFVTAFLGQLKYSLPLLEDLYYILSCKM